MNYPRFALKALMTLTTFLAVACTNMEVPTLNRTTASSRDSYSQMNLPAEDDETLPPEDDETLPPVPQPPPTPPTPPASPNPEPNPTPVPQGRPMALQPVVESRCTLGELDLVKAYASCGHSAPLLVTVRDQRGDQVLGSIATGQSINSIILEISRVFSARVEGREAHIAICIDASRNGSCGDEPVQDLNQLTELLVQNSRALCDSLRPGFVVFHRAHDFETGGSTNSNSLQGRLQNVFSPPQIVDGVTTFPIALFRLLPDDGGRNNCIDPFDRVEGCFVKGTEIALSPNVSVPVETIGAGMSVLLADGRRAKVIRTTAGPEPKPVIHFELTNGSSVTVTTEHPMLTKAGVKAAKDIKISDELAVTQNRFSPIRSLSQKEYKDTVYNFALQTGKKDQDHLIISNGIITGDLHLQDKINRTTVGKDRLSQK